MSGHSSELVHELLVELLDAADPLGAGGQEGGAEVQAALPLAEAGAGDDADAGGLEQAHAVELVGGAALLLGGLGGLGRDVDGGEQVHGALGLAALDALHVLEGLVQGKGALLEAVEDLAVLLVVELKRRLALLGRVDHELDQALADDGGAQGDGDELVDLGLDLGVEADQLKVATAVAALAHHALGDGVQRCELDALVLVRVLLLELEQDLAERVEGAEEDVGLVDLIGHDDQVLLDGKVDHGADVALGERSTRRVTGVDDDDGPNIGAAALGLFVRGLDLLEGGAPVGRLVKVVGDTRGVEDRQRGGIQGVLGDGNEDSRVGAGAYGVEESVDTRRGTGREVDVSRVSSEAVALYRCVSRAIPLKLRTV